MHKRFLITRYIPQHLLLLILLLVTYTAEAWAARRPAGGVTVNPRELSLCGDSLLVEFSIHIYSEAINPRQSWSIIPRLTKGDDRQQLTLPYLLINGKIKEKHYKRRLNYGQSVLLSFLPSIEVDIPLKRDTTLFYRQTIVSQPWMVNAELEIHQVLTSSAGKEQLFTIEKLARVDNKPTEIVEETIVAAAVQPEDRETLVFRDASETMEQIPIKESSLSDLQTGMKINRGVARLDFPQGVTDILPFYGDNQQKLAEIYHTLTEIRRTPGARIESINITGYASPEGMYITNEGLAIGRARSFMNYLQREFGFPDYLFRTSCVAEDWDKLRELVEASHMYRKHDILYIIDRVGIFEGREGQLMLLDSGFPYREMSRYMFPELRRVEYTIEWRIEE